MTLYFILHIYKHTLGNPESLTESPSTLIYSPGASGVNLDNLAMTQLRGWKPAAKSYKFTNVFESLQIYENY